MKKSSKSVRYIIAAFALLFIIAIGNVQEAKAVKVRIATDEGTGIHIGTIGSGCGGNNEICITIELSITSQAGTAGEAILKGNTLLISFKPDKYLLSLNRDKLKFGVEKGLHLGADFSKLLGATDLHVLPGTYQIKLEGDMAKISLRMKAKEKANRTK